jgi:EmrB/QacA subfamily drug resistance transporter
MAPIVNRSHAISPCAETSETALTSPCAPSNRKWVLIATILGSSLAFMDGSIVNIALPALQSSFRATSGEIQWVIQSYALFGAALLLLGGAIGDRYGRRRAFAWGVAVFTLASAACAASHTLGQLVFARSIQGIGAALLVPQGLAIISASFPEEERGRAIGLWSAWTSVFVAVGPVAGGWLMQIWNWRLLFLLNLPLALLVFLLVPKIPESTAQIAGEAKRPLDFFGATLNTLSFAAIIYALSFASQIGWRNPRILGLLLGGIVLFVAFLKSQAQNPNAMMPLSLFRISRFSVSNVLTFLLYGALGGALYVSPFYLIQVRRYTPTEAGAAFIPLIALMFIFSSPIGSLVSRFGERRFLIAGSALAGLGFAAFAILDHYSGYAASVLPGVCLLGLGMTLAVTPLTTAVMASVPSGMTGMASAINNTVSRLAALLSVSAVSLVLAHGFMADLKPALDRSDLPEFARQQIYSDRARLHDIPLPDGLKTSQRTEANDLIDHAFLSGFRIAMFACAFAAGMGAFAGLGGMREKSPDSKA